MKKLAVLFSLMSFVAFLAFSTTYAQEPQKKVTKTEQVAKTDKDNAVKAACNHEKEKDCTKKCAGAPKAGCCPSKAKAGCTPEQKAKCGHEKELK